VVLVDNYGALLAAGAGAVAVLVVVLQAQFQNFF
jgi:hypothetical protein